MTIRLKEWDKILVLMDFELNQTVGLGEHNQSKFLGVLVTTTHVHNALDSNLKSNHSIERMWWDIGVGEVWQQLDS